MRIAKSVKAVATGHLEQLLVEAGFRKAYANVYHCALHVDRRPSAHLYVEHVYCFSCARAFDVINLAQLITKGSARDAIHWLADRYGVNCAKTPFRPRFSETTLIDTELFRIGYRWWLEEYLRVLKELWLMNDCALEAGQIRRVTSMLSAIEYWSDYEMADFFVAFRKIRPGVVATCIREAKDFQIRIATLLFEAAPGETPA